MITIYINMIKDEVISKFKYDRLKIEQKKNYLILNVDSSLVKNVGGYIIFNDNSDDKKSLKYKVNKFKSVVLDKILKK